MQIICNNCASGFLYKKMNMMYNNPFMWNLIPADSFLYLMLNWDNINFNKIDFPDKTPKKGIDIIIDSKIIIRYIHILYDKKAIKPIKNFVDVYYNKPWEYALEKYNNRCKRMFETKENPIFLIVDDDTYSTVDTVRHDNSIEILQKLNDKNFKYEIIWATKHNIDSKLFSNLNLKIIHPKSQYVGTVADYIIENKII